MLSTTTSTAAISSNTLRQCTAGEGGRPALLLPARPPGSALSARRAAAPTHDTHKGKGDGASRVRRKGLENWWSVSAVQNILSKRRYEPSTQARIYEADVYPAVLDFAGWHHHRSKFRYIEHMLTIFRSHMVRQLTLPILTVTAFAAMVGAYNTAAAAGTAISVFGLAYLGSFIPPAVLTAAWEPYSLMSFALSLMLVFRTNSSYARWVEARALWAVLINSGRNLVRMALAAIPESDPGLKLALGRWAVAFSRVSKLHLREEPTKQQQEKEARHDSTIRNYTPGSARDSESNRTESQSAVAIELQDVLQPNEISLVEGAEHKPGFVLQLMSRCVYASRGLDGSARVALDVEIKQLQDALGGCERILRNPIPLSYTRHTARFLVIWLLLLPLALWEKMSFGVVPATLVVSYLLFGIDEIAIQMEEPFGILPLEVLCDGLQRNVKAMLDSEEDVQRTVDNYKGSWGGAGQVPSGWEEPPVVVRDDAEAEEAAAAAAEEQEGVVNGGTGGSNGRVPSAVPA